MRIVVKVDIYSKPDIIQEIKQVTYRNSSPTATTQAVRKLFRCDSPLLSPLLTAFGGDNFFALPALSNLPSVSMYAGLNFSLLPAESLTDNNAFGAVSFTLPIDVYL